MHPHENLVWKQMFLSVHLEYHTVSPQNDGHHAQTTAHYHAQY